MSLQRQCSKPRAWSHRVAPALAIAFLGTSAGATGLTFQDGTFVDSDWRVVNHGGCHRRRQFGRVIDHGQVDPPGSARARCSLDVPRQRRLADAASAHDRDLSLHVQKLADGPQIVGTAYQRRRPRRRMHRRWRPPRHDAVAPVDQGAQDIEGARADGDGPTVDQKLPLLLMYLKRFEAMRACHHKPCCPEFRAATRLIAWRGAGA